MPTDSPQVNYDKPMTPVEAAMDFFRVQGWEPQQAAGIVGNLDFESAGMNPNAVGDGGKSHYLPQLNGDRLTKLHQYAASKGENIPSFGTQLEYVQKELEQGNGGQALRNARTVEDATKIFSDQYERPGVPAMQGRIKRAHSAISSLLSPTEARAAEIPASPPQKAVTPTMQGQPPQSQAAQQQPSEQLPPLSSFEGTGKKQPIKEAGAWKVVSMKPSQPSQEAPQQATGGWKVIDMKPSKAEPLGENDEPTISNIPKNAPSWAHNHPDAYWNVVDTINVTESATDVGAMMAGGAAGTKLGAIAGTVEPGGGNVVGGLVGGLVGAGMGYAIKNYGADKIKQYLGLQERTTVTQDDLKALDNFMRGVTYEASGGVAGKVAGEIIGGTAKAIPFTKKSFEALEGRAGAIIEGSKGTSPVYAANEEEARKVADEISGYKTTVGEMRNDPGLIKLQRGIQKGPGEAGNIIAENQATNNQAVRDYLSNEFKGDESIDDVIAALNKKKAGLEQATEAAQNRVGPTVENLKKVEGQETGGAAREVLQESKAAEKSRVSSAYQKLPNTELPVSNTGKALQSVESEFAPGEESAYPSSVVSRIKKALPKSEAQEFINDPETGLTVAKDQPDKSVGFKDLHSLRKDIGRQLRSATTGANPNLELARRLRILQEGIDADIEAGMGADNAYVQARKEYGEYIQTFRKGPTGKVLQQGQESTGFAVPTASVTKRFATPDGADSLIRAIGKDKASIIMEGHFTSELETSGIIGPTGEVNGKSLNRWMMRNRSVLEKYGLTENFKTVQAAQDAFDAARGEELAFGKSIASKLLNADPKEAIAAAMGGAEGISAKNTGKIMQNILDRLEGHSEAIKGLKNAFKDFLIGKAETTAKDIEGGSVLSNANVTKSMSKYDEAMKVLYKDEPSKLNALKRVQKAVEISNRSKFSPSGAGSDTAELMSTQRSTQQAAQTLLGIAARKIPGSGLLLGLAKGAGNYIKKLSKDQVNGILVRALYDPDAAYTLVAISRGTIKRENIPSMLAKYVSIGGTEAAIGPSQYGSSQAVE
jgi:hypothetical protein